MLSDVEIPGTVCGCSTWETQLNFLHLKKYRRVGCVVSPFVFWSVTVDEEQADWNLLASAVPFSSQMICLSPFYYCIQQYQTAAELYLVCCLLCFTGNNKYGLLRWKELVSFINVLLKRWQIKLSFQL